MCSHVDSIEVLVFACLTSFTQDCHRKAYCPHILVSLWTSKIRYLHIAQFCLKGHCVVLGKTFNLKREFFVPKQAVFDLTTG